jgi:hypothetical protein
MKTTEDTPNDSERDSASHPRLVRCARCGGDADPNGISYEVIATGEITAWCSRACFEGAVGSNIIKSISTANA